MSTSLLYHGFGVRGYPIMLSGRDRLLLFRELLEHPVEAVDVRCRGVVLKLLANGQHGLLAGEKGVDDIGVERRVAAHGQKRLLSRLDIGRTERVAADLRVRLHDGEFLLGKLSRLQQDGVGNPDLADIVHGAGLKDLVCEIFWKRVAILLEVAYFDGEFARVGTHAMES